MRLRIRIFSTDPHKTYVLLSGEVDLETVQDLRATLEGVAQGRAGEVILDLSELSYLGSVGVSVMIKAMDDLEVQGRRLVLTGAHGSVKVVLQMLGLAHLLDQTTSPHLRGMSASGNADCTQG